MLSARGVHAAGFIGNPVARGFNLDRGFDEFHSVYTQKVNLGEVTHADAFRNVLPGFFQGRAAGRFFAYVHYLEPHFPYDPPPPFNTMFGPDAPLSREQRRQHEWFWAVNEGRVPATREEIDHLVRLYDGGLAFADREVGFLRRSPDAHLVVAGVQGGDEFLHAFVTLLQLLKEVRLAVARTFFLQAGTNARFEQRRVERLGEVILRAHPDAAHDRVQLAQSRNHDDRNVT